MIRFVCLAHLSVEPKLLRSAHCQTSIFISLTGINIGVNQVPIIVAINKIDKSGADIERSKQSLTEVDLVPEEWGGKTPVVPISAKKGDGKYQTLPLKP